MLIDIPDDWMPTDANVNALPQPLQDYIHKLVTHMDPALTLQQNAVLRDQVAELQTALALASAFGRP